MKRFQIVLTALGLAGSGALLFAFTNPNTHKPLFFTTLYYDINGFQQRGAINPGTQTLILCEVKDLNNWTTDYQSNATGAYLNAITFLQEPGDISDGIADGTYSRQEAINELWNQYVRGTPPQYDLPTNLNFFYPPVFGATLIIVERRVN